MEVNYYNILKVTKNASVDDLKKAYHTLAMRWHPDKNPRKWKTAEALFEQVCEAYKVLIDPNKRAVYDKYGVEGLKGQESPRNSKGSTFKADEAFGGGGGASVNHRPQKPDPIEKRLPCSLEELYKGSRKKIRIFRKITDKIGEVIEEEEEILTIDIKLGSEKENKIILREKGDQEPNMLPSDVVFIIDEMPHNVFTRDGNDLVATQNKSSLEFLSGYTVNLTTLDGKSLKIPINKVITPSYEEVVQGEGMPIKKEPYKWDKRDKGNLRIKFNIKH